MSLKKLTRFQKFDTDAFFNDKQLLYTKLEEWKEGEDADHLQTLGTKVTGVIVVDRADYGDLKEVNRGESLTFKVQQPVSAFSDWKPFGTIFKVTKVTKASVYGDDRNQLSVTVPNLERIK